MAMNSPHNLQRNFSRNTAYRSGFVLPRNNLVAWFDPALVKLDSNDKVVSLASSVGNHTLLSPGGTNSPAFNGRLIFQASMSQRLVSTDSELARMLDGEQAYTVYYVASHTTETVSSCVWSISNTDIAEYVWEGYSNTGMSRRGRRDATGPAENHGTSSLGTAVHVRTSVYNGESYFDYCDGSLLNADLTNARSPSCDTFVLGARKVKASYDNYMEGEIGDIVIFLEAHEAEMRALIENWLLTRV